MGITTVSAADSSSVQNGPDLVITNLTAPAGAAPGGQIIVPNTVENQGNSAAGGFYVTYYLTKTQYLDNATLLGSHYIPSNDYFGIFGAGASKSDNTVLNIPSNIAVGQYYFAAVADGFETVEETNENNNVLFYNAKINIKNGPELVMTSLNVPTTGLRGKTISVSNTVKNQGNLATGGFYITYYLTTAQNMNIRTKIGSRYIKSLAAGATNTNTTTLTIPSTINIGQYYIATVVDSTNLITEVNETNNNGFSTYKMKVQDGRDLLMTSITAPTTGLRGKTISVSNTVKNQGNLATGGFYITYYLTTAQNMNIRTKIGSRYIKSLAAGATNTNTTTLTIPSTINIGQYYIAATVDSSQQITEVNETNNNQYSTGKINVK